MSDDLLGGGARLRARAAPTAPRDDFGADLDGEDALDGAAAPAEDASVGADLLSKKKARQTRLTFKETHLIGEKGMWRLYEEMQRLPISRREGDEVRRARARSRTGARRDRGLVLTRLARPILPPPSPPRALRRPRTCCS